MQTLSWITLVTLEKIAKNTSRTSFDFVKEQKHIMPHNALNYTIALQVNTCFIYHTLNILIRRYIMFTCVSSILEEVEDIKWICIL